MSLRCPRNARRSRILSAPDLRVVHWAKCIDCLNFRPLPVHEHGSCGRAATIPFWIDVAVLTTAPVANLVSVGMEACHQCPPFMVIKILACRMLLRVGHRCSWQSRPSIVRGPRGVFGVGGGGLAPNCGRSCPMSCAGCSGNQGQELTRVNCRWRCAPGYDSSRQIPKIRSTFASGKSALIPPSSRCIVWPSITKYARYLPCFHRYCLPSPLPHCLN